MSWPTDGLPRFVVTSVTGYSGDGGNSAREATMYQVIDRPYCCALCLETPIERVAERVAAAMNSGDLKAAARVTHRRARKARLEALYRSARRRK